MDAIPAIPAAAPARTRLVPALLAAALLTVAAGPVAADADAAEGRGAENLEVVGEGEYRWFGLQVYHASFATETGRFSDWTDTQRARFEIYYHRDVPSSRLVEIAREEWDRLGIEAPARWFGWLRQVLPDVREGDTLACLVLPDERTVFYHNGEKTGEVAEPEFGPAFLSIWLHPEAKAADLRRALLGASGRS